MKVYLSFLDGEEISFDVETEEHANAQDVVLTISELVLSLYDLQSVDSFKVYSDGGIIGGYTPLGETEVLKTEVPWDKPSDVEEQIREVDWNEIVMIHMVY